MNVMYSDCSAFYLNFIRFYHATLVLMWLVKCQLNMLKDFRNYLKCFFLKCDAIIYVCNMSVSQGSRVN